MSFESDLFAFLEAAYTASPQTLGGRFYTGQGNPSASLPYGFIDTTNEDSTYRVGATGASGVSFAELDFYCYGDTKKAAHAFGAQLLALLEYYTGMIGSTRVTKVSKQGDLTDFERESGSHYRQITLTFGYT